MSKSLLLIALLLVSVFTLSATPQAPRVWEYKFEYKMNEKKANQLGTEGWELAAIESTSTAGIGNNVPTYVFKRAK